MTDIPDTDYFYGDESGFDDYDEYEGDCPSCWEYDLIERKDVDKNGIEFTYLVCPYCNYTEQ